MGEIGETGLNSEKCCDKTLTRWNSQVKITCPFRYVIAYTNFFEINIIIKHSIKGVRTMTRTVHSEFPGTLYYMTVPDFTWCSKTLYKQDGHQLTLRWIGWIFDHEHYIK